MAELLTKDTKFFYSGSQVTGLVDLSFTGGEVSEIEVTTKGDTARRFVGGFSDPGTIDVSVQMLTPATGIFKNIRDRVFTSTTTPELFSVEFGPGDWISGSAFPTSFEITSDGFEDVVTAAISLKIDGPLTGTP